MNTPAQPLVRRLDSRSPGFEAELSALLQFDTDDDSSVDQAAAAILLDVRRHGDAALLEYTRRFDRLTVASAAELEIPRVDMLAALNALPLAQRRALEQAAERVRAYHERQRTESWTYREADGSVFGQKITPLDRAGLYVPGGKAA